MSRSSFRLTLAQSLLLLLMLLLMATLPSLSDARAQDKLEALRQLRELVESELERRQLSHSGASTGGDGSAESSAKRASGGAATLDDVLAGAKAFGSGLAAGAPPPPSPSPHRVETTTVIPEEAVTTSWTNGTLPVALFSPLWFSHLLASMLKIMPLAAWIAVLCAAGLLLLLLLVLLLYCCCCRKRERQHRKKGGEFGKEILFSELDIVGKKAPPYGEINFSLEYDVPTSQLIITASSCIGLPKDPLKELDPYIVVHVETTQKKSHTANSRSQQSAGNGERSKVVKNSVNPAFNFTRVEKIKDKRDLKRMVITFEVYDWDIGTRHRMIARRVLKLAKLGEKLDKILGRKREYTRELYAGVNQEATGPGDICVALCYSTQDKHLWVHVIECKGVFLQNFGEPDLETLPNTYLKLALSMAGSGKKTTRSTKLIKSSRNPYFNEQFVFKLESMQMMRFASLRLSLLHRTETLRIKRVIGSQTLSINADKSSLEFLHWDEAMSDANQGRPLARWHSLITPEQERLNAERKAAAERKKALERAEEESAAAQLAAASAEQE